MFEFSFPEFVLCAIIGLLVLGPKRLPKVAAELGKWVGRARRTATQLRRQLEREIELSELETTPAKPPAPTPSKPTESAAPEAPPAAPAAPEPTIAPPMRSAEPAEPVPMDDPPDGHGATRAPRAREQLETTDTTQT